MEIDVEELVPLIKSIFLAFISSLFLSTAVLGLFIASPFTSWITFSIFYAIAMAISSLSIRRFGLIVPAVVASIVLDLIRMFFVLGGVIVGGVLLPFVTLLWEGRKLDLSFDEIRDMLTEGNLALYFGLAVILLIFDLVLGYGTRALLQGVGSVTRPDIASLTIISMLYILVHNTTLDKLAEGVW